MELEESSIKFDPPKDARPHMPEPPVVRVTAIEDVRLPTVAGLERQLVEFYRDLLKFEWPDEALLVFKAENVSVLFTVGEGPPHRDDFRPLIVEVPHFADLIKAFNEREVEYEWQRGITPGTDTILLRDPAGNWVSIGWRAEVR